MDKTGLSAVSRQFLPAFGYMTLFYLFVSIAWTLSLDLLSSIVFSFALLIVYHSGRNPKWLRAQATRFHLIANYKKSNQSHALNLITGNILWIYILFLSFRIYTTGFVLFPEHVIFYCLVGAMLVGKGRRFVEDWVPLFILFFAYEAMRGFADTLGAQIHFIEPIAWDQALFGFLPNEALQNAFYFPGTVQWYDVVAMSLYALHMGMPLIFAFLVWVSDRENFLKYSGALLLTAYLGLVTFMVYPMAPPWLAAESGLIDVRKVLFECSHVMNFTVFPTLYTFINSNPVAAMPSLHAAFPILMLVFAARVWGWKAALPTLLYAVGMWLSLVYLGEHYVIDLLAGFVYAVAGLLIVDEVVRRFPFKQAASA